MPSRSYLVQAEYLKLIQDSDAPEMCRDETIDWEIIHMVSSARTAYIIAGDRGVDSDLAACASTLHDIGRVISGKQDGHAEAGYAPAKEFLRKLEIFTDEEIEQIALAVKNHSKKGETGSPLEEIVKDSDVLDMFMYDRELPRKEQQLRLDYLRTQLSLPNNQE